MPTDAEEDQRYDPNSDDEVDQAPAVATVDENQTPEQAASKRSYLPSSLGLSVLVPLRKQELQAIVRYGEYLRIEPEEGARHGSLPQWRRNPHEEILTIELGNKVPAHGVVPVPNSRGVEVVWSLRGVPDGDTDGGLPKGTQSLSIFVVNRRKASPDEVRDEGLIFQVELEVQSERSFIARPNLHSLESDDWDERVADLQYRNSFEFSVGHGVSTESVVEAGSCKIVRTCHLPTAEVEKVAPSKISGVTLNMETLAFLRDGEDAMEQLGGFASSYEKWIEAQKSKLAGLSSVGRRQHWNCCVALDSLLSAFEMGLSCLLRKTASKRFGSQTRHGSSGTSTLGSTAEDSARGCYPDMASVPARFHPNESKRYR